MQVTWNRCLQGAMRNAGGTPESGSVAEVEGPSSEPNSCWHIAHRSTCQSSSGTLSSMRLLM